MQVVIEIPDDNYVLTLNKIMLACRGCKITELPRRHGRLVDAESIYLIVKPITQFDSECAITMETAKKLIFHAFDEAPTVIEADEEREVKE